MRRILVIVLTLFALLTVNAAAGDSSGNCGANLTWSLSGGVLTISGSGEMTDYSYGDAPWYGQRERITSVIIGQGVTTISPEAFSDCANIESVSVPDSLTGIGDSAFSDCTGIKSVYIDSIESWCGITFGTTSISEKSNPLNNGADLYCGGEKVWELIIPDSVSSIGAYQFYGCTSIRYAVIPDSVTSIGKAAFSGCTSLIAATVPGNVTEIPDEAFRNCSAMTCVIIPSSVTSIGSSAFYGCDNLAIYYSGSKSQWSTLKDNLKFRSLPSTTNEPHYNCGLFSWSLSAAGVLTIYGTGSMGTSLEADEMPWYSQKSNIKSVVIKNGITVIAPYAFKDCTKLESVIVPNTVTTVGTYAFSGCVNLKTVAYRGDNWSGVNQGTCAFGSKTITPVKGYFMGDVNKDDTVGTKDTELLFEHILKDTVTGIIEKLGNVNGDKVTDIGDVQRLYRHANNSESIPDTLVPEN